MVRLLLLTVLPLIFPFAVWYVWRVFLGEPNIDGKSGEEILPDFGSAPRGRLLIIGLLLMTLTLGSFMAAQQYFVGSPYKPLDMDKFEERERQKQK